MAGLAAARARGRFGGRRSKLSADQRRTARKLYDERELTVAQIREGPRGQPHVDLPGARQGRGRSGGRGDRAVNAGERLVTVLQQEPLVALARPPIRWIQRTPTSGTPPRTHSDLAGSEVETPRP